MKPVQQKPQNRSAVIVKFRNADDPDVKNDPNLLETAQKLGRVSLCEVVPVENVSLLFEKANKRDAHRKLIEYFQVCVKDGIGIGKQIVT